MRFLDEFINYITSVDAAKLFRMFWFFFIFEFFRFFLVEITTLLLWKNSKMKKNCRCTFDLMGKAAFRLRNCPGKK